MIARKITLITGFEEKSKIIFFTLLSISFLYFTSYGEPVFIVRAFLLLVFILFLLNSFSTQRFNKIYLILIGLLSSLSMFWYIDIGIYINLVTFIFAIFFFIRSEFKSFFYLISSVIMGWIIIFFLYFPQTNLASF